MIISFRKARIEYNTLMLSLYDVGIHAVKTYTRVAVRGLVENRDSNNICSTTIAATAVAVAWRSVIMMSGRDDLVLQFTFGLWQEKW